MHNLRCAAKLIGLTVLAFGVGLLASFFLPAGWLVVIEAVVIIGVGFLYFARCCAACFTHERRTASPHICLVRLAVQVFLQIRTIFVPAFRARRLNLQSGYDRMKKTAQDCAL